MRSAFRVEGAPYLPIRGKPTQRTPSGDNSDRQGGFSLLEMVLDQ
jgi:hypothetical protein